MGYKNKRVKNNFLIKDFFSKLSNFSLIQDERERESEREKGEEGDEEGEKSYSKLEMCKERNGW